MVNNATLIFTNNLKIDMLKTICTALKHELVSSKPVKTNERFYIFFAGKKFFLDEITNMCRLYLIKTYKIPNYRIKYRLACSI